MRKKNSATTRTGGSFRIALGPELDAAHGAELRNQLDECLDLTDTTVFVGEDVVRVDAAGLQVLVAFINTRRAAGRSIDWESASHNLRQGAELLGVSALIGLKQ